MKQNKYDDKRFFEKYSVLDRSKRGLEGAAEWGTLRKMLPEMKAKRILDLGCGFGWHCRYAVENGAEKALGIDISANMIKEAKSMTQSEKISYICLPVEDISFDGKSFDIVISSLVFHYVGSFENICKKIHSWLTAGGDFVFSVEHPVFTAHGSQDWHYDKKQKRMHWPVDNYFSEGKRDTVFLGEQVEKYHKTFSTYINTLIQSGFEITAIEEPRPDKQLLKENPETADELRRPGMLIVAARKK